MTRVTPPDLELWLTAYVRAALAAENQPADVDNKEPDDLSAPLARPLVIIRDDSGAKLEQPTFDRSLGVTVLGGTRRLTQPANDLARLLLAILTDDAIAEAAGSPIAAVVDDGCNGPYAVSENLDLARRYLTVEYTVVGTW